MASRELPSPKYRKALETQSNSFLEKLVPLDPSRRMVRIGRALVPDAWTIVYRDVGSLGTAIPLARGEAVTTRSLAVEVCLGAMRAWGVGLVGGALTAGGVRSGRGGWETVATGALEIVSGARAELTI
jgi:hypothetical protein